MKKKVAFINVVCNGSTGKIMCETASICNNKNIDTYCFYGRGNPKENINCIKIGGKFSHYFHGILARFGLNGKGSYFATKKLVKKLKKIKPDVIQLHNIHGYYLNIKVLFNYLKKEYAGKIVWTLHDCWAFTGHCSHFIYVDCSKWKDICYNCPQLGCYPKEYIDTTKMEYKLKKELFTNLGNLTIVTPSIWLSKIVKKSFLKDYEIKVINNGIDINIFKENIDEKIYDKYSIPKDKKIILGVSSIWNERKGINDFIELSKIIPGDMKIVLVGEKTQELPDNIIYIHRTDNQEELAKIYSLATVLFNPTYEDTYPTINLESISCNTPVITYDSGGSSESIYNCGMVIEKKDYKKLIESVNFLPKINTKEIRKKIDNNVKFMEYVKIYKK